MDRASKRVSIPQEKLFLGSVDLAAKLELLEGKLSDLEQENTNLKAAVESMSGRGAAAFVHWGERTCPTGSKRLFEGFAGGAHYEHGGGYGDRLCLPKNGSGNRQKASNSASRALIYQTEFETTEAPFNSHANKQLVCAFCEAEGFGSTQMFVGLNACPGSGWTKLYDGWAMGQRYNHPTRELICVPETAQGVGTAGNENGVLLYFLEVRSRGDAANVIGSDIQNSMDLACVVCAK